MKRTIIFTLMAGILAIGLCACGETQTSKDKPKELLTASWAYNYGSVEEMAESSDMIALIEVEEVVSTDESAAAPNTEYQVKVLDDVYNSPEDGEFVIVMTGVELEDKIIEIADDPLMQIGDQYLVFCKKNSDGTYRVLSGSQGRLAYENGKLNSLNVIDEQVQEANEFSAITVDNEDADEPIEEVREYVEDAK